jgi:N-acetylmuramoyl-L-alanine amidase
VAHRKGSRPSSARDETIGAVPIALRLVVIVSCIAAIGAMAHGLWGARLPGGFGPQTTPHLAPSVAPPDNPPSSTDQSVAQSTGPSANLPPSATPAADSPVSAASRVGVVAGHWGNDTGATCPDGLTEVEINLDVAERVAQILQALGYQADVLKEFDPRLNGYRADALISIHADSCNAYPNATPPASGFKVASVEDSMVPEAEEQLVACLAQCYAARTGMYFHANSITYDMTRYHTFYEIDGQTPAAIIEIGFMLNDRHTLTQRPDLVAQAIVQGLVCFIEGERP